MRIGIDTGGTFTDFVRLDERGIAVQKLRSTPDDPSRAILAGLSAWTEGAAEVTHGSTVATNAVLERKGARVALVTTAGFEDVLRIGRQTRAALYDFQVRAPRALVEPGMTFGVQERLGASGEIVEALTAVEVARVVALVCAANPDSVAVCLLHSYANGTHERMLALALRETGVPVSISSEVLPEYREFERWSTTAVNAYVTPLMAAYLGRLEEGLAAGNGLQSDSTPLRIMQSNGGSISAGEAKRAAVQTILSGPAAGAVGAQAVAAASGFHRVITFDMGGTSTDVSLIDGALGTTGDSVVGDFPVRLPVLDIHTVGAGGGSIAYVDGGGSLRVGPRSAGATPGPACYGKGTDLTVTDANLLLGRLDAEYFLGGRMALDLERARAIAAQLGTSLGLSERALAEGVVRIANANMERAIRVVSVQRGHDPRDFALLAFGGAGGLHACALAESLEIATVLIPQHSGVLSALGMLLADVTRDYSASVLRATGSVSGQELEQRLAPMRQRAAAELAREGFDARDILLEASVDMRYKGQAYELAVPLTPDFAAAFHRRHHQLYGYSSIGRATEIVQLRLKATGRTDKPALAPDAAASQAAETPAAKSTSAAVFNGIELPTPLWHRDQLAPGMHGTGPAIVITGESTNVVAPGWTWTIDRAGTLVLTRTPEGTALRSNHAQTGESDPVEFEIFKNFFVSVAEEMGVTLCRTGFSPNIKERLDYSCAIYDAAGETIAQGDHLPVHLGAMPLSVRAAIDHVKMQPGDMVVLNDPFRGGTHLPDITLVAPVFLTSTDAEPSFYVANRAHHSDVGGMSPGSMPLAREVYQEGLILPPVRLVKAGKVDAEIMAIVLANVRTPEEREGDLTAQIAANRVAETRLLALVQRYGHARVAHYAAAAQDYAERILRRRILEIPDGRYEFADALDNDGFSDARVHIRCAITIAGDSAEVDFTGTDAQTTGGLNANLAITLSATLYCFRCLITEDVLYNSGIRRPVTVIAPEGSVVNARRPSAVAGGNVETSQRITDVVLGALARALPGIIPAASQGTMNNVTLGGIDPRSGTPFAYYETAAGGMGGRPGQPGLSGVHTHMSNTRNTPVEAFEQAFPLRIRTYALREGCGGAGAFAGGEGLVREYEALCDVAATLLTERRVGEPYGAEGGRPGGRGRNTVLRANGEREVLPAKTRLELHAGDRLRIETPGGGGSGA
jgi:N-methylhydantoinase A/oxoprolinase/acetone carboxylase beta subunit/N-methylhydantoinase B/oxoprolinase/acetone carboxylase alpha subunit